MSPVTHERRALGSGSLVDHCPACRDEPAAHTTPLVGPLTPGVPGWPEVECEAGHRFTSQFWSLAPDGDRFVLARRVAGG